MLIENWKILLVHDQNHVWKMVEIRTWASQSVLKLYCLTLSLHGLIPSLMTMAWNLVLTQMQQLPMRALLKFWCSSMLSKSLNHLVLDHFCCQGMTFLTSWKNFPVVASKILPSLNTSSPRYDPLHLTTTNWMQTCWQHSAIQSRNLWISQIQLYVWPWMFFLPAIMLRRQHIIASVKLSTGAVPTSILCPTTWQKSSFRKLVA